MSESPETLAAHLAREVATVCQCWRVTRRDGTVAGFTDHDRPLTVAGTTFEPRSGFTASEARETLGLAADTVEIEGAISAATITAADIAAGRWDGATVETLLVNWHAPGQATTIRSQTVGRITRADNRFVAELDGPEAALDRTGGRWFRRRCDAELGDQRCGVDLDDPALKAAGAVTAAVSADTIRVTGIDAFPASWFAEGRLTATGGAEAGTAFRVLSHRISAAGIELVLWRDGAGLPGPDDGFEIVAGCDKRFSTCKAKFSNHLNFRGFPHLPGNDAAYGYATEDQVFDGSPLVP
jgi:uncharacterized phage protein (TIGR02218 family)